MDQNKIDTETTQETRVENSMEQLKNLVQSDFQRAITQLINEIDLLFEYVPKETKDKLQKYCSKVCSDEEFRKSQMTEILSKLKPHEANIYQVSIVKKKTKTSDLQFMDSLVLFDDILHMKLFMNENKNTKISLVNYLSTMYMAASFGSFGMGGDINMEELAREMQSFVESVKERAELNQTPAEPKQKRRIPRNNATSSTGGLGGMGGLLNSIMSNSDIMNMAADLTKDLQNQNVDPMTLMTSLMSGKPNGQLDNIVNKITSKLEQKISSGEIDKDALEQQAEQIMSAVNTSELASQVPMLQGLMQMNTKNARNNKK